MRKPKTTMWKFEWHEWKLRIVYLLRLNCMILWTWNLPTTCCDIHDSDVDCERKWKVKSVRTYSFNTSECRRNGDGYWKYSRKKNDLIEMPVPPAINSIFHRRQRLQIYFHAVRNDISSLSNVNIWIIWNEYDDLSNPFRISNLWCSLTFRESTWRTRRAYGLLMTPFPHLHGAVLTASQIERHQGMRTHALYVVHFMFQYLGNELKYSH